MNTEKYVMLSDTHSSTPDCFVLHSGLHLIVLYLIPFAFLDCRTDLLLNYYA